MCSTTPTSAQPVYTTYAAITPAVGSTTTGGGPVYTTVNGGGAPPQKYTAQYATTLPVQGGGPLDGANTLSNNPQIAATLTSLLQALTALTQMLSAQSTNGATAPVVPAAPQLV